MAESCFNNKQRFFADNTKEEAITPNRELHDEPVPGRGVFLRMGQKAVCVFSPGLGPPFLAAARPEHSLLLYQPGFPKGTTRI